ncbi:hypothetical protein M2E35_29395, partial [Klebsiella pneumoniae]|nr:hypothetical protein [Klebsiella pneumoniae]
MAHDVPLGCAPDEYDDLISGTCSHLPQPKFLYRPLITSLQVDLPAFHSQIFEENIVPEAVEINAVKRISVAV